MNFGVHVSFKILVSSGCKPSNEIAGFYGSSKNFPSTSAGKESACNAGDPCLIPGLRRSPGEGIDHLFQYSQASLVPKIVKNLPAMRETWV